MRSCSTTRRRVLTSIAAIALVGLAIRGFWIEPRRVDPIEVSFACGSGGEAPLRVVLFSDVGFVRAGVRERAVRDAASRFAPDVVLVAGDFFDDLGALDDPEWRRRGAEYLQSLPSGTGRFLVPGEMEARRLEDLRAAIEPGATLLVNASRRIDLDGSCLEVFGSHEPTDAPAWANGADGARRFVTSRNRPGRPEHRLRYVETLMPGELTLAFQSATAHARIGVTAGGVRVERHEGHPDFRVAGVNSGFVPPDSAWCRARIQLEGKRVRARFWEEGATEPDAWAVDTVAPHGDAAPRGELALLGLWGEARYADLVVWGAGGETLLAETFGDGWRSRWDSGSALERWLEATADSPCARVVLAHNPDIVRDVRDLGPMRPCVVLAGHTHGGQVRLPWIGALYSSTWIGRRFDRGRFDYDGVSLYITAGVSTSIVPVRLFDPPEVTLVTLEP